MRALPYRNIVFPELFKQIPWAKFDLLVEQHKADWDDRGVKTKAHLIAMLYAQFGGIRSLREIETTLKSHAARQPGAGRTQHRGSARAPTLVGGKAADNTGYARDTSKPSVVTVESALLDDMKKGADDYRRKDVFEFRPFNATHLEITRNGQTLSLERIQGRGEAAPDKWKRVSPTAAELTKEPRDGLLRTPANTPGPSFVAPTHQTRPDQPRTPARRVGGGGGLRVGLPVGGGGGATRGKLAAVRGLDSIEVHELPGGECLVKVHTSGADPREELARAVVKAGFGLRELHSQALSLEDVFISLTTEEPMPWPA